MAASPPGGTVAICAGEHVEALTIGRDLTLRGEPGAVLASPGWRPALTVRGASVDVSDLTFGGGRTAIRLEAATLRLERVDLSAGIDAEGSDTSLVDVSFTGGEPAVLVRGGALDWRGGSSTGALGAAIRALADASISVADVSLEGVAGGELDGVAIEATDSAVALERVAIRDVDRAIMAVRGGLSLTGLTLSARAAGLGAVDAAVLITGSELSASDLLIESVGGSLQVLDTRFVPADTAWSWAIHAVDTQVQIQASTFVGGGGAVSFGSTDHDTMLTLRECAIERTRAWGVRAFGGTTSLSDTQISGVINEEGCLPAQGEQRVCGYGLEASESSIELVNTTLADHPVAALISDGNARFVGGMVRGAAEAGVASRHATLQFDGTIFVANGARGLDVDGGSAELVGVHFSNHAAERITWIHDDRGWVEQRATGAGVALSAAEAEIHISDSQFDGDDRAIEARDSELFVADTVISDVRRRGLGLTGGTASLQRLTLESTAGGAILVEGGVVTVEALELRRVSPALIVETTTPPAGSVEIRSFSAVEPAIRLSDATLVGSVVISDVDATAVDARAGTVALTDPVVRRVSGDGLVGRDTAFTLDNPWFEGVDGAILRLSGGSLGGTGEPIEATCDPVDPPTLDGGAWVCAP